MPYMSDFSALAETLTEQLRHQHDDAARLRTIRAHVHDSQAAPFLEWLTTHPHQAPLSLLRLVQYQALMAKPIITNPNLTHYEWAGDTLKRLLGSQEPVSETWSFFSGPSQSAVIADTAVNGLPPLTMHELVTKAPEILGPAGMDPDNHQQKYFFVKFLDPSDFPTFAYVGFRPEAVNALGLSPEAFRAYFADLLWQERRTVEAFQRLVAEHVTSHARFQDLKAAYKGWATHQAAADWQGPVEGEALSALAPAGGADQVRVVLAEQQRIRSRIVRLLHRIDYTDGQAILIETPTLHAIAGLSLQAHPKATGNFYPKDELWIYRPIEDLQRRRTGWIVVEPQRTFDKTESGADFFTPFIWKDGALAFRKPITPSYLRDFVALIDVTPHPRGHYLRTAQPMDYPGGSTSGRAQWYRLVEEPAWPYFLVRELRFSGSGTAAIPLTHHSFIELHATQGLIKVTLSASSEISLREISPHGFTVTPTQPVLLPATLPHETITYQATAPAQLMFFTRESGE